MVQNAYGDLSWLAKNMQCCSSARLAEVKALNLVLDFVGGQTEE